MAAMDEHIQKLETIARDLRSSLSWIEDDPDYAESKIKRIVDQLDSELRRLRDSSRGARRT